VATGRNVVAKVAKVAKEVEEKEEETTIGATTSAVATTMVRYHPCSFT